MNLTMYTETRREALFSFRSWWLEGNERNPGSFPMTLNEADWDEQFENWIDTTWNVEP